MPVPPAEVTSSAVSSIVSGRSYSERRSRVLRPGQYTVAPASPSATAVPRPAPRVAPATSATLPSSAPVSLGVLLLMLSPLRYSPRPPARTGAHASATGEEHPQHHGDVSDVLLPVRRLRRRVEGAQVQRLADPAETQRDGVCGFEVRAGGVALVPAQVRVPEPRGVDGAFDVVEAPGEHSFQRDRHG